LGGGYIYSFTRGGELLFTITKVYPGGPILSVEDAEGNEIRGKRRRAILRILPRHFK